MCSKCGEQTDDLSRFCKFCGNSLESDTAHPSSAAGEPNLAPREIVRSAIERRRATDRRISPAWTAISILPLIASTGIMIALIIFWMLRWLGIDWDSQFDGWDVYAFMAYIGRNILTAVFAVLFGLLTYNLLDRLNRHIAREEQLRAGLMSHLRSVARRSGGEQRVLNDLLRLSAFDGQAMTYEKMLDSRRWGWGVFGVFMAGSLLGLAQGVAAYYGDHLGHGAFAVYLAVSLLVYLFAILGLLITVSLAAHLMRTIVTHDLRWHGFTSSFQAAMSVASKDIEMPVHDRPLKERSMMLYSLLTIVTFGLFAMYWLYVLIEDPNRHFDQQHETEDAILAAL